MLSEWFILPPLTDLGVKWLSLVQLKTELYTSIWGLSLKIFSLSHSSFKRRSYFIPTSSIPCACLLACLFVVSRSTCLSLSFLLYIYLFCFGACFLVVSVVSLFVLPFTFFYGISNFFLFFFFWLFFNKIWNLSEANTPISARINCKSSRVSLNRTGFSTKLNLIPIFPTVTNSIHCFIDPITILAGLLLHRSYKETNRSFWICLLRISNWWFARYEQLQRPIWCISDQTQAVSVTVSSSGATIWYQH